MLVFVLGSEEFVVGIVIAEIIINLFAELMEEVTWILVLLNASVLESEVMEFAEEFVIVLKIIIRYVEWMEEPMVTNVN